MSDSKRTAGLSMLEIIITLGIIAILFGLIANAARPPFTTVFANDLAAVVQQSRYEAIQSNGPVVLVHVANKGFEVRTPSNTNSPCSTTNAQLLRSLNFTGYGTVNVSMNKQGIIWFPNGLVIACDGTQATVNISVFDAAGKNKTREITINSIGRVEIK